MSKDTHKAPNYGPYRTVLGRAHRCDQCEFCNKSASGLYGFLFKCVHKGHIEKVSSIYGCDDWSPRKKTGGRAKYRESAGRFFRKS